MKVLLYFENENLIKVSGIGRAFEHQKAALTSVGIDYTTDPYCDDYDILHINTCGINSESIIKEARNKGKKVIYHAHSTEEDFKNSFVLSNVMAPIFKMNLVNLYTKADAIITPTPYSKKLLQNYGITLPIYPISNGVDISQFCYNEEKVKAYRRYFSLTEKDKVIIGVGLPFVRKGLLDFVEVSKQLPQYKFIWFGEINPMAVPSKINEVVQHHPDNCYFPGYVKGPIIQGAYAASNAFFFPSYEETEGIVVLEALAASQQVVVRDIGVFDPWLKDRQDCYKGKTNEEFCHILRGLLEGQLPSTKDNGFHVAQSRTIDTIGQRLKHVYEVVLNGTFDEQDPYLMG